MRRGRLILMVAVAVLGAAAAMAQRGGLPGYGTGLGPVPRDLPPDAFDARKFDPLARRPLPRRDEAEPGQNGPWQNGPDSRTQTESAPYRPPYRSPAPFEPSRPGLGLLLPGLPQPPPALAPPPAARPMPPMFSDGWSRDGFGASR